MEPFLKKGPRSRYCSIGQTTNSGCGKSIFQKTEPWTSNNWERRSPENHRDRFHQFLEFVLPYFSSIGPGFGAYRAYRTRFRALWSALPIRPCMNARIMNCPMSAVVVCAGFVFGSSSLSKNGAYKLYRAQKRGLCKEKYGRKIERFFRMCRVVVWFWVFVIGLKWPVKAWGRIPIIF